MTFDEWADSPEANRVMPDHSQLVSVRELTRRAWNAATTAERERCARIADTQAMIDHSRNHPAERLSLLIANRIRSGDPYTTWDS